MSSTDRYLPPTYEADGFNCPHPDCGAYAHQVWHPVRYGTTHLFGLDDIDVSVCGRCHKKSYWLRGSLFDPPNTSAPPPHPDMPAEVIPDYDEARLVASISPRSACALLRLAVQKLCGALGESGDNINDDIGSLVKKGLPIDIQQALDSLRVIGNNAVHPGELDLRDDSDTALALFDVMNYIVEQRITQPKKLQSLYERLPDRAREAIDKRDRPREAAEAAETA